jgi:hypothetical protein
MIAIGSPLYCEFKSDYTLSNLIYQYGYLIVLFFNREHSLIHRLALETWNGEHSIN